MIFCRKIFNRIFILLIAFANCSYGVVFECDFITVEWTMIDKAYACAPTLKKSKNEHVLDLARGEHHKGKANVDVQFLYLQKINLQRLPREIEKIFPNLEGIELHNANVTSLVPEDLKPFPNLLVFSSYFNRIESIDGDLFKNNPKLKWVIFHANQLKHVGHDLFANLVDLEFVNFETNPCINMHGKGLKQLQEVNLALPIKCPPLAISPTELLRRIGDLEDKVVDLSEISEINEKKVISLKSETSDFKNKILKLEKQTEELSTSSIFRKLTSEISDYIFKVFTLF